MLEAKVTQSVNFDGLTKSVRASARSIVEEITYKIAADAQRHVSGDLAPRSAVARGEFKKLGVSKRKYFAGLGSADIVLNIRTGQLYQSLAQGTGTQIVETEEAITGIVFTAASDNRDGFGYAKYWETHGRPFLSTALAFAGPSFIEAMNSL